MTERTAYGELLRVVASLVEEHVPGATVGVLRQAARVLASERSVVVADALVHTLRGVHVDLEARQLSGAARAVQAALMLLASDTSHVDVVVLDDRGREVRCVVCGTELVQKRRGRSRRTCSTKCRGALARSA